MAVSTTTTEPHPRALRRLRQIRRTARVITGAALASVLLAVGLGTAAMAAEVPSDNPDRLWTHVISTTSAIAFPIFILSAAALIAVYIATSIYRQPATSTPKES